jgi:soluble lytic murein transglycosylase
MFLRTLQRLFTAIAALPGTTISTVSAIRTLWFQERKSPYRSAAGNSLCRRAGCPAFLVLLFSLSWFFSCASCGAPSAADPAAETDPSVFYRALRAESHLDTAEALELFEEALGSDSYKVRGEAALRLGAMLPLVPETEQISPKKTAERLLKRLESAEKKAAENGEAPIPAFSSLKISALYVLGHYRDIIKLYNEADSAALLPQDRAYILISRWILSFPSPDGTPIEAKSRSSPLDYAREFFYAPRASSAGAVREQDDLFRRTMAELEKHRFSLTETDLQIMEGRFALSRSDYGKALRHFEEARKTGEELFFLYPELLGELGRACQWTPSGRAPGLKLFAGWEKTLAQKPGSVAGGALLSADEIKSLRYFLLFYSGRIVRQQGDHAGAAGYFTRALEFAPDARQEDACLWYILNCGFTAKPADAAALVKNCAGRWHDAAFFTDILDDICCYLAGNKKWADLGAILDLIRDNGAESAQYAYITGRAVKEGYVSARGRTANDYFAIAYEEGNASFYYRALAASYLGKAVVPLTSADYAPLAPDDQDIIDFYRGFFTHNAQIFALDYLRRDRENLNAAALRAIAGHFAEAGQYLDSINIVRSYMRRENYTMERADLELYYPRAFTGLIDAHARAAGIRLPVFFGLVRTESAFMPEIASHAGAVGLAQIMPATAREINAMIKRQGGPDYAVSGSIDLRNPETNLRMGAVYLSYLTRSLESPMLALLAYNGGPGRIRRLRRAAPGLPEDLFLETITTTETRE